MPQNPPQPAWASSVPEGVITASEIHYMLGRDKWGHVAWQFDRAFLTALGVSWPQEIPPAPPGAKYLVARVAAVGPHDGFHGRLDLIGAVVHAAVGDIRVWDDNSNSEGWAYGDCTFGVVPWTFHAFRFAEYRYV